MKKTFENYRIFFQNQNGLPVTVIECSDKLAANFDTGKIFDCGQCFRFEPVPDTIHETEYAGVAFGRFVSFAQDRNLIYIYNSDADGFENIWRNFLSLDTDYDAIDRDIVSRSDKDILKTAVSYGKGIRILRQDMWETVCSFIVSQNNNIPRIKKIVGNMSERLGEPFEVRGMINHGCDSDICVKYSFPTPQAIYDGGVDILAELRTGFRAKYIYDAARCVLDGTVDFGYLTNCPDTAECCQHLCAVKGIGPKVALCSLLFGFGKYDAFPIDVWIRRVIEKYFSEGFSVHDLGAYAGIAQQYLFYYERYINSRERH